MKLEDGSFEIWWAEFGDTSTNHTRRRGRDRQDVKNLDELQKAVPGLTSQYIENILKAPVGKFMKSGVGGAKPCEASPGAATGLRVGVVPFGTC